MKIKSTLLILTLLCSGIYCLGENIIFHEDFSDNTGLPDGWSTEDLSGQNVDWIRCGNFNACGISANNTPIDNFYSSTATDGFALLNSDAYNQLSENHISTLISSTIDCSELDEVFFQFQTAIGTSKFNPAENAKIIITNETGSSLTLYPFQALGENNRIQLAPIKTDSPNAPFYVNYNITNIAANMEKRTNNLAVGREKRISMDGRRYNS